MTKLINKTPDRFIRIVLGILPFVLLVLVYLWASDARLAANPNDKLLPAPGKIVAAMQRMAFEPSKRSGNYLLWADTLASLQRLAMGVGISALIGLVVGVSNGALPYSRASWSPLVTTVSLIPPMAILPILHLV